MPFQSEMAVKDVQRLTVRPGDTLVITVERGAGTEECQRIAEVARAAFPDTPVWIMAAGCDLSVISSDGTVRVRR